MAPIMKTTFSIFFFFLSFCILIKAYKIVSMDLTDNKSELAQVMVSCRKATHHYINQ